jgi:hypothetical protein
LIAGGALATVTGQTAGSWRDDPAWSQGKAEWALYDATRVIYGKPRRFEATIFTNRQRMDRSTTTKAADWRDPGAVDTFKHNVSELVPTDNYTYRFLTTTFHRADTLAPYKVVASTQEDCGATYRQFVVDDGRVRARSFCYFPEAGESSAEYALPTGTPPLRFHDGLTLALRDYPFDTRPHPELRLQLVPDQTDTHETDLRPEPATVRYAGRETITTPMGAIDAHHLRVEHSLHGGVTASDYWFAADPRMRHVLVKYAGPWGVTYELKRLDWWAYWADPRP